MNLKQKLYYVRYRINQGKPHIHMDSKQCLICDDKPCIDICPAGNFTIEDGTVVLAWEDCLECGACRIACIRQSICWEYPDGRFGISYRYG